MDDILRAHAAEVTEAAEEDLHLRNFAIWLGFISVRQALEMPGGLSALFHEPWDFMATAVDPYLKTACGALLMGWPAFTDAAIVADLQAVGEYLRDHPRLPWVHDPAARLFEKSFWEALAPSVPAAAPGSFDATACLGGVALMAILSENDRTDILERSTRRTGPLCGILPYLERRSGGGPDAGLPDLPVPEEFRQVFRDWAEGRVNFTEPG